VKRRLVAGCVALAISATGCSTPSAADRPDRSYAPAREALAEIAGRVFAQGPYGEEPSSAEDVTLTEAEMAEVAQMDATAAIVMHYTGDGWTNAQIAGLRQEFGRLGIEVIAVTDAGFEPDTQVANIESVLARQPDIIVSIPTDPVATAGAYRRAAEAGVQLVFMDNVPAGMQPGRDYVSAVSADNYGNGVVSAHLMADALGGAGEIGVVYHEADFFVTRQRYDGFTETIREDYPDIEIVEEKGVTGPDFAGQAQAAATAMLVKHQDLAGIWGVWDVPTEGIMAAARAIDRTDLVVTTEDLGPIVAISMAAGELVTGLGAQRPFDQGITEARLAAYGLLGKPAPPYVALDALPVTRDNLLDAWREVYREAPPEEVVQSYEEAS